tara:strand:+ start:1462 stop:2475 length:1014 start_codon:yes stop_codon:yes gene_type:complete
MIDNIRNVAIVGGCGFIGHNLALHLNKNYNINVSIIDSLSVNNLLSFTDSEINNKELYTSILNERIRLLNKNKITLRVIDARNYHLLSNELTKIKPDVIVHLAAVSHANKSNKDPHSTFDHSLRTLENTLDWARYSGTKLVYLSSSMVYGNFDEKVVDETNSILKPIGIYGTLKLCGELMVKSYNQVFDLPYIIIRPSALYGERCVSRRVGQIFIENAIQGLSLEINGTGDEKLDFTYIEDLLNGISLSIINNKVKNETFNITYGQGRKINEMLDIIKSEFPSINVTYKDKDSLTPERGTLSTNKAAKILNYKSQYSLEEGYTKYIKWYKDFASKVI